MVGEKLNSKDNSEQRGNSGWESLRDVKIADKSEPQKPGFFALISRNHCKDAARRIDEARQDIAEAFSADEHHEMNADVPESLDTWSILRNRDLIKAHSDQAISELASLTNPDEIRKGYEEPFHEMLRVEVAQQLSKLRDEGGARLDAAFYRYPQQFVDMLFAFGIQDNFGFSGAAEDKRKLEKLHPPNQLDGNDNKNNMEKIENNLDKLYEVAEQVNPQFQRLLRIIPSVVSGCTLQEGPIKGRTRSKEKAIEYGNVRDLKDMLRGRFTFLDDPQVGAEKLEQYVRDLGMKIALMEDEDNPGETEEMIKDSFLDDNKERIPLDKLDKYADVKITVEMTGENPKHPIKCEIVFATPEMAAATWVEHPLYEVRRTIMGELAKQQKRTGYPIAADDPRRQLLDLLSKAKEDFFRSEVSRHLAQRTRLAI